MGDLDGTFGWVLVGSLALLTAVMKGIGPVLLGERDLPARLNGVVALLPAAMMSALVLTATLADDDRWAVDASLAGVGAAGVLLWRRVPLPVAVLVAVAVTAGLRAVV